MANIRIDNFSGDTVTVLLDGKEAVIEDDGRVTFDTLEKGKHTLHIHRTRVPFESVDTREAQTEDKPPFGGEEKSLHTQLDLIADIDLNSSKAILTVKTEVTAKEGRGMDVLFSSYSVTATGAKIEDSRKLFANSSVKKTFTSHHIKNALFPVGLCGAVILLLGLFALLANLSGSTVNLGGTQFTLPWSLGLTAVGIAIVGYSAFCIANVFKAVKKFKR